MLYVKYCMLYIIMIYNCFYQAEMKLLLMYLVEQTQMIESVLLFKVFHFFKFVKLIK